MASEAAHLRQDFEAVFFTSGSAAAVRKAFSSFASSFFCSLSRATAWTLRHEAGARKIEGLIKELKGFYVQLGCTVS